MMLSCGNTLCVSHRGLCPLDGAFKLTPLRVTSEGLEVPGGPTAVGHLEIIEGLLGGDIKLCHVLTCQYVVDSSLNNYNAARYLTQAPGAVLCFTYAFGISHLSDWQ